MYCTSTTSPARRSSKVTTSARVVVVKAVPRLGQIAFVAAGGLRDLDAPVRRAPQDARLADLDLLAARLEANLDLLVVARGALGAHVDQPLNEAFGQAVAVHAHHRSVEQTSAEARPSPRGPKRTSRASASPSAAFVACQIVDRAGFAGSPSARATSASSVAAQPGFCGRNCNERRMCGDARPRSAPRAPPDGPAPRAGPRRRVGAAGLLQHRAGARDVATALERARLIEDETVRSGRQRRASACQARRLRQIAASASGGSQLAQDADVGFVATRGWPESPLGVRWRYRAAESISASASCTDRQRSRRSCGQAVIRASAAADKPRVAVPRAPARAAPGNGSGRGRGPAASVDTAASSRCCAAPKPADAAPAPWPAPPAERQRGERALQRRATVVLLARHVAQQQQGLGRRQRSATARRRKRLVRRLLDGARDRCPRASPGKIRGPRPATPAPTAAAPARSARSRSNLPSSRTFRAAEPGGVGVNCPV